MKNIMFELAKAADLICLAYEQDILYDFDVLKHYEVGQSYLWCCNDCGTHICKVEYSLDGGYYPDPIFYDGCFSGSARLTAFIRVRKMKGGDKHKLPFGEIIWVSFDRLKKILERKQNFNTIMQWDLRHLENTHK